MEQTHSLTRRLLHRTETLSRSASPPGGSCAIRHWSPRGIQDRCPTEKPRYGSKTGLPNNCSGFAEVLRFASVAPTENNWGTHWQKSSAKHIHLARTSAKTNCLIGVGSFSFARKTFRSSRVDSFLGLLLWFRYAARSRGPDTDKRSGPRNIGFALCCSRNKVIPLSWTRSTQIHIFKS